MLDITYFPKGYGLDYDAPVTENEDGTIAVGDFTFTLDGKSYAIAGKPFTLVKGATVYITTAGLQQCKGAVEDGDTKTPAEYPADDVKFPNNSVHWLLTKLDDTKVRVLEVD